MAMASTMTEEEVGRIHGGRSAVDFGRVEFLEIIHVERPGIVYKSGESHFFFVAGLAVRTSECSDSDFPAGQIMLPWIAETARLTN